MIYSFQSIDEFLFKHETEIINSLYDYNLLTKFSLSVRKIIIYYFVKNIEKELTENPNLLFYHTNVLSDSHELFSYFEKDKIEKLILRLVNSIKKVTHKVFVLGKRIKIPSKSKIDDLDGAVLDELSVLDFQKPINPKDLKNFLDTCHLPELFKSISKQIY